MPLRVSNEAGGHDTDHQIDPDPGIPQQVHR